MAHGSTCHTPFGQRTKPLKLMRKMMIPIFAKFVAKKRHWNARQETFVCKQIVSIFVMSMSPSSHLFISICHMAVSCGNYMMCCDHRGHHFGTTTQFGNMQCFSAIFVMCTRASPELGGFQDGHGKLTWLQCLEPPHRAFEGCDGGMSWHKYEAPDK